MASELYRLRVGYRKDGRLAYLGHLEVIATVERCIRRAGLPFSVGNGFAHRMRLQFSQALPVGASSAEEYYDVMLTQRWEPDVALEALKGATPAALGPTRAAYVPRKTPALEAWLNRSSWQVELEGDGFDAAQLAAALDAVREQGEIHFMRGDKPRTIGLADTFVSAVCNDEPWGVSLALETRSSNLGALRPAVLMDAAFATEPLLGARREALRVVRVAQAHEEEGQFGARLVNPFAKELINSLT